LRPLTCNAIGIFDALADFGPDFMPEGREDQPAQARESLE
jgi:hypothetical protein